MWYRRAWTTSVPSASLRPKRRASFDGRGWASPTQDWGQWRMMSSCQRMLTIYLFNVDISCGRLPDRHFMLAVNNVHVSQAYVRTARMSDVWYTLTLVGNERYWSLQISCRDDMTADARAISLFLSALLTASVGGLGNVQVYKVFHLFHCDVVCYYVSCLESVFWILVFVQETHRPTCDNGTSVNFCLRGAT